MNDYDKATTIRENLEMKFNLSQQQKEELTILIDKLILLPQWQQIYNEELNHLNSFQDIIQSLHLHIHQHQALNKVERYLSKNHQDQVYDDHDYQNHESFSSRQLLTQEEISLLLTENENLLKEYDIDNNRLEKSKYEKYDKGRKTHIRVDKILYDNFAQLCQKRFGNKRHAALLVNLFMKEFVNDKKSDLFLDLLYKTNY